MTDPLVVVHLAEGALPFVALAACAVGHCGMLAHDGAPAGKDVFGFGLRGPAGVTLALAALYVLAWAVLSSANGHAAVQAAGAGLTGSFAPAPACAREMLSACTDQADDVVILPGVSLARVFGVVAFAVALVIDVANVFWSKNELKRELALFVIYVNCTALSTYIFLATGIAPDAHTCSGRDPLVIGRYIEWLFTTPMDIYLVAHLGRCIGSQADRKLLVGTMAADVLMLVSGYFASTLCDPQRRYFLAISCISFGATLYGLRAIFEVSRSKLVQISDQSRLQTLFWATAFMWSTFPAAYMLREVRYIDASTEDLLFTLSDIFAKVMYSVLIQSGNFYVIDHVERIKALKQEQIITNAVETARRVTGANELLTAARDEAESVAQLHRTFIANMSHELRTPLNSVIAFNSLLLEGSELSDMNTGYVHAAITSAEALLGMINQILEYAKLENCESNDGVAFEPAFEDFNLADICNELVDIVGRKADKNNVELIVDPDPQLAALHLKGDPFRLRQVLINICDNGIKFTKEGGQVTVRVTQAVSRTPGRDQEGRETVKLVFRVADSGIGIPPDKVPLVFKPFSQVYSSSTRRYGGTGLGLIITKRIVERMGGTISMESTEGVGTSFTIDMPMVVVKHSGVVAKQVCPRLPSGVNVLVSGARPDLLAALHRTIDGWGASAVALTLPCAPDISVAPCNSQSMSASADSYDTGRRATRSQTRQVTSTMCPGQEQMEVTRLDSLVTSQPSVLVCEYSQLRWLRHHSPWYARASVTDNLPIFVVLGRHDERTHLRQLEPELEHVARFVVKPVKPAALHAVLLTACREVRTNTGSGTMEAAGPKPSSSGISLSGNRGRPTRSPAAHQEVASPPPAVQQDTELKVLLVEDNLLNQRVAEAVLRRCGVQSTVAHNGEQAVKMIEEDNRFDLILMDVQMPVMDGLTATRLIREFEARTRSPDSPHRNVIVAMTANASAEDREECIAAGMNQHISKPIYPQIVRNLVLSLVERKASQGGSNDALLGVPDSD